MSTSRPGREITKATSIPLELANHYTDHIAIERPHAPREGEYLRCRTNNHALGKYICDRLLSYKNGMQKDAVRRKIIAELTIPEKYRLNKKQAKKEESLVSMVRLDIILHGQRERFKRLAWSVREMIACTNKDYFKLAGLTVEAAIIEWMVAEFIKNTPPVVDVPDVDEPVALPFETRYADLLAAPIDAPVPVQVEPPKPSDDVALTMMADLERENLALKKENESLRAENISLRNENTSIRNENTNLRRDISSLLDSENDIDPMSINGDGRKYPAGDVPF